MIVEEGWSALSLDYLERTTERKITRKETILLATADLIWLFLAHEAGEGLIQLFQAHKLQWLVEKSLLIFEEVFEFIITKIILETVRAGMGYGRTNSDFSQKNIRTH